MEWRGQLQQKGQVQRWASQKPGRPQPQRASTLLAVEGQRPGQEQVSQACLRPCHHLGVQKWVEEWKGQNRVFQEHGGQQVADPELQAAFGVGTGLVAEGNPAREGDTILVVHRKAYPGNPDQEGNQGGQSADHKEDRNLEIAVAEDSQEEAGEGLETVGAAEAGAEPEEALDGTCSLEWQGHLAPEEAQAGCSPCCPLLH